MDNETHDRPVVLVLSEGENIPDGYERIRIDGTGNQLLRLVESELTGPPTTVAMKTQKPTLIQTWLEWL